MRDLIKHDALLCWFSAALIGAFRSSLFHSVICSLGGPLSHGSPVVVFFDRGHPRFWNFYSTIPVDVARVKSYMNCLFERKNEKTKKLSFYSFSNLKHIFQPWKKNRVTQISFQNTYNFIEFVDCKTNEKNTRAFR